MTLEELYFLDGFKRLEAINDMTIDERDDICETFEHCDYCPMALIYEVYNGPRAYCTEPPFLFRAKMLMAKGAKFRTLEEYRNNVHVDEA